MPDPVDALRPHLAAVWEDRDPLVARVAAEVIARVPSYATTPSSEAPIRAAMTVTDPGMSTERLITRG